MQNTYKCNQILAVLRVVPLVVRDQEVHAGRARGQTWAVRGPRRERSATPYIDPWYVWLNPKSRFKFIRIKSLKSSKK